MTDYKRMFEQAIRTLVVIDEALGIDGDGCNDPGQTLYAIARLKSEVKKLRKTERTELVRFADEHGGQDNWDKVCEFAETLPQIREHLQTWGPHCGAPYAVYRGHLVSMILGL